MTMPAGAESYNAHVPPVMAYGATCTEAELGEAMTDSDLQIVPVESPTLTALRDTLLPKLISGELRVKDAERLAGRLA